VPVGVITFRRFELPHSLFPEWKKSDKKICDLHLTTGKKIEEVDNVLQVNITIFVHVLIEHDFHRLILLINLL
jgi:hypothetical protein